MEKITVLISSGVGRWLIPLIAGFVLDLLIGDPHWLYHPVRLIGKLITALEGLLRRIFPCTEKGELIAGGVMATLVVVITAAVTAGVTALAAWLHPAAGLVVETILCYQLLATRALRDESMKVFAALKRGDLPGARYAVSMIVGRDTDKLTEAGVTKAAVETVAENASDGVIAPLLYLVIGGPCLGFAYKAVNTMDSMVGYKNERYLYFGRAAARLDDAVNYIPARLCALLMVVSSFVVGLNGKKAWQIFQRDRYNHASPNSAQTEAVMAGALEVQLAGDAYYFGELHRKKTIGDDLRPVRPEDIPTANRLLYAAAVLGLIVFTAVRVGIGLAI